MKVLTCSLVAFVTVVACANMLLNPAYGMAISNELKKV